MRFVRPAITAQIHCDHPVTPGKQIGPTVVNTTGSVLVNAQSVSTPQTFAPQQNAATPLTSWANQLSSAISSIGQRFSAQPQATTYDPGTSASAGSRMAAPAAQSASTVNNSSQEAHIGSISISTMATEAKGIAADLGSALQRNLQGFFANKALSQ